MPRIENVEDAALDAALRFIRNHTSPLFLDGALAGSGTFISWDDQFGILTAHHVPHNPLDSARRFDFSASSGQKLGLSLVEYAHRFELEMRYLGVSDIALPIDPADPCRGPDLAVIRLGNKASVQDIEARKSFYRLSYRTAERLEASLRADGIFAICGAAKEEERQAEPELGFSEVTVENLCTYYGGLVPPHSRWFERDGYEYIEIDVRYPGVEDPPKKFGGVSGGGLWQIAVQPCPDDPTRFVVFDDPVLAGVAFCQGVVDPSRGFLRCHAGGVPYRQVLTGL
ncbi:hypothetical protein KF840_07240 [bacterium]|nr:hypothetical protein [bacterium]